MRTDAQLRAAVCRGIRRLNEKLPKGAWRALLQLNKQFDFSSRCQCVVGTIGQCERLITGQQTYDSTVFDFDDGNRGERILGVENEWITYGFDWECYGESEKLAALWKRAIKTGRV